MHQILHRIAVTVAATACVGIVGLAAPDLASASPTTTASGSTLIVDYKMITQSHEYDCGPASTEIALSSWAISISEDKLIPIEHTTTAGTNSIDNVTYAMNKEIHATYGTAVGSYHSVFVNSDTSTDQANLKARLISNIQRGYAFVANVHGTATDTAGHSHTYSGGHFLAIVGYENSGADAYIADNANGTKYVMSISQLTYWIETRGYTYLG